MVRLSLFTCCGIKLVCPEARSCGHDGAHVHFCHWDIRTCESQKKIKKLTKNHKILEAGSILALLFLLIPETQISPKLELLEAIKICDILNPSFQGIAGDI